MPDDELAAEALVALDVDVGGEAADEDQASEAGEDALAEADNVLKNAVKGISELITISSEGNINLDFRDVETTMRNGGGAIMAIGRASGHQCVERASLDALDSPLLAWQRHQQGQAYPL